MKYYNNATKSVTPKKPFKNLCQEKYEYVLFKLIFHTAIYIIYDLCASGRHNGVTNTFNY